MEIILSVSNVENLPKSVIQHPLVSGIRLNTASTFTRPIKAVIINSREYILPKRLWIDLKGRELRVKEDAIIPAEKLTINHCILIPLPTRMYFNQGANYLIVEEIINGNQLIFKQPQQSSQDFQIKFGAGASVNIPDAKRKNDDYLTSKDREFIKTAKNLNIHDYMASYIEKKEDIEEIMELDPEAKIVAKIESKEGMIFVRSHYHYYKNKVQLMVARGDLFIELDRPHLIGTAMREIISKDPTAIVGSRILESLLNHSSIPNCSDITDVEFSLELGYQNFLLGDELCADEVALKSTIGLMDQIIKSRRVF